MPNLRKKNNRKKVMDFEGQKQHQSNPHVYFHMRKMFNRLEGRQANMIKLTDREQAFLMFLAFLMPAIILWVSSSNWLTSDGLRILIGGIASGIIAAIKELLGWKPRK